MISSTCSGNQSSGRIVVLHSLFTGRLRWMSRTLAGEDWETVIAELSVISLYSASRSAEEKYGWMLFRMSPVRLSPRWLSKEVKRGSLIYTDKFRCYNDLISYGFHHMKIVHGKRFVNGMVYLNGIEGIRSFAKERLMKYLGVNPKKIPLSLIEL